MFKHIKPMVLCMLFIGMFKNLLGQANASERLDSAHLATQSFSNYIKYGHHRIEVAMDEKQLWNFALRTGFSTLQHILLLGVQSGQPNLIYTYGYGLGTQMPLQKNRQLAIDFSAQQLNAGNAQNNHLNLLTKCYMGILFPVNSKLDVTIGPTADIGLFKTNNVTFKKYFSAYASNYTFSEKFGATEIRFWVGVRAAVRVR